MSNGRDQRAGVAPVIDWIAASDQMHIGLARSDPGLHRVQTTFPFVGMILRGAFELRFGSRSKLYDPGSVLLLNPGDECGLKHLTDEAFGVCLGLDPAILGQAFAARGIPVEKSFPFRWAQFSTSAQAELMHWVARASLGKCCALREQENAHHIYARLIHEIVAATPHHAMGSPPEGRAARDVVYEARKILSLRYRDQIGLPALADSVGCSEFYLCRRFRRETGMTIHQYVNRLRLREAAVRLVESTGDLATLAVGVGYCHHSHFSLAFRREFGMSPRKWRAFVQRGGHVDRGGESRASSDQGNQSQQARGRFPVP